MPQELFRPRARAAGPSRHRVRSLMPVALGAMLLGAAPAARAFEYGPLSLTGFVKVVGAQISNYCERCQREQGKDQGGKLMVSGVLGFRFQVSSSRFRVSGLERGGIVCYFHLFIPSPCHLVIF